MMGGDAVVGRGVGQFQVLVVVVVGICRRWGVGIH